MRFRTLALMVALGILSGACAFHGEETAGNPAASISPALPFMVSIGGASAVPYNEYSAKIPDPLARSAAKMTVHIPAGQTAVVNITQALPEGLAKAGLPPVVMTADGGIPSEIPSVGDPKVFPPGLYLMNVGADGKIATVLFEIKD
ncbi:MAG: hypothetical protein JW808_06565 [Victivallales bacterium]|nr:hypothetical protein [Victivallales bacterium]